MLKAVRPVVVGLLLWTAYDMASTVFGRGSQDGVVVHQWTSPHHVRRSRC